MGDREKTQNRLTGSGPGSGLRVERVVRGTRRYREWTRVESRRGWQGKGTLSKVPVLSQTGWGTATGSCRSLRWTLTPVSATTASGRGPT